MIVTNKLKYILFSICKLKTLEVECPTCKEKMISIHRQFYPKKADKNYNDLISYNGINSSRSMIKGLLYKNENHTIKCHNCNSIFSIIYGEFNEELLSELKKEIKVEIKVI